MHIIEFTPAYQERIESFVEVMYSYRGYQFDPMGLHSDIRNIPIVYQKTGGNLWLLCEKELVIGSVALKVIDRIQKIGELKRYFVLPLYQGKGFGRRLIEHVISEARSIGLKKLRLDTMKNSLNALAIFYKCGFYEIDKYNDNNIAEIFMEKIL